MSRIPVRFTQSHNHSGKEARISLAAACAISVSPGGMISSGVGVPQRRRIQVPDSFVRGGRAALAARTTSCMAQISNGGGRFNTMSFQPEFDLRHLPFIVHIESSPLLH